VSDRKLVVTVRIADGAYDEVARVVKKLNGRIVSGPRFPDAPNDGSSSAVRRADGRLDPTPTALRNRPN